MPDPGRAGDPAAGSWANTKPGGTGCDAGAAVKTVLTLNPAARAASWAWLAVIPTTFGTRCVALDAGGVPPTAWQGDSGVGVARLPMPGSTSGAVLVDGAEAISSQTNAPGTALLPAVGDWAMTVPAVTRVDGAKYSPSLRPTSWTMAPAASIVIPTTLGTVTVCPCQLALTRGDSLAELPDAACGAAAPRGPGICAATNPTVTPIATTAAASTGNRHDFAVGRADRVVIWSADRGTGGAGTGRLSNRASRS